MSCNVSIPGLFIKNLKNGKSFLDAPFFEPSTGYIARSLQGQSKWEGGMGEIDPHSHKWKSKQNLFWGGEEDFLLGAISLLRLEVLKPPKNKKNLKTFPGPLLSYTVKKNNIGSAVSKILHTDTHTHTDPVTLI